mmetsp:Transcript_18504/g.35220  ORF Transcript_18504/g.35220 Transcript_18504/m.35220 type:complete len:160 (-) Transcript_18504:270-749(-)
MPTAYDPQYYTFTKQLVDVKPCIVFKFDSTEEYTDLLATQGLKLVEVYSESWGPCYSILPTLKRIKVERDPDPAAFQYDVCLAEKIENLKQYSGQAKPTFLFYRNGKLVETIEGPNTPAIERAIYANTPANPDADDLDENPFYLAKKAASRPNTTAKGR